MPHEVSIEKHGGFRKKTVKDQVPDSRGDYFKGFMFGIGRDCPDLYKYTIDQFVLYTSTQLKNWTMGLIKAIKNDSLFTKHNNAMTNLGDSIKIHSKHTRNL